MMASPIAAVLNSNIPLDQRSPGPEIIDGDCQHVIGLLESIEDPDGPQSDENTDDEKGKSRMPYKVTEKRRAHNAIFEAYVNKYAKSIFKAARKIELADAKDEELTIASILAKQQTETIKDPREYQIELFNRAKKENIIAVLDTGSGKTLIAVLLLKEILDMELEDRAAGLTPRVSFFLVRILMLSAHLTILTSSRSPL
jgi:endoribonuclease Dicer